MERRFERQQKYVKNLSQIIINSIIIIIICFMECFQCLGGDLDKKKKKYFIIANIHISYN